MKGMTGYVVGAVALAILGGFSLGWSRLDRAMASSQQALITSDYDAAGASLQVVERYYGYLGHVPGMGNGGMNDLRARRAAINYWRGDFRALAPADRTDPVTDVATDNVPLQVIVADSVYRAGRPLAKDRAAMLQLLDSSIGAYRSVLGNARRPEDARDAEIAAYNYEYLVRLRNAMLNDRRRVLPPPPGERMFGTPGKQEDPGFENQFKRYIPLEKEERDDADKGKFTPPVRKG